jgi:2',3'-cyclic-nucleotide 2'-phosphodiesterase/3'-nucleotidase/5'-nucleotidase
VNPFEVKKTAVRLAAAVNVAVVVAALLFVPRNGGAETLTILHTNDTHAHLDDVARRAGAINIVRREAGKEVLLLDAGDVFTGTPYFMHYKGLADLRFMEHMGYDAMCLGNHEFDQGPGVLARFVTEADFPVLCANFEFSAEPRLAGKVEPWVVIEKNGHHYGVFGLTIEDTVDISSPGPHIVVKDPVAAATAAVAFFESRGIHRIIALTHLGWHADIEIARLVEGIDIIIGGHSHTLPEIYPAVLAEDATPTLVVQAGQHGKYLGRLDVAFDPKGVVESRPSSALIEIHESMPEDPRVAAELAPYKAALEKMMNLVVGETVVHLDGESERVRIQETNLGNLITDAMLEKAKAAGATIAIQNGGGIRASIEAGEIRLGQIMTVQPFGNYLVVFDLNGKQIVAALENGLSQWEKNAGRFPHVAGLRYAFTPGAPPGSRVLSVQVRTPEGYRPLHPSRTYRIVTNSYLHRGGDGYAVFREGTHVTKLAFVDWTVLKDYIEAHSPLNPRIEGRITNVASKRPRHQDRPDSRGFVTKEVYPLNR